MALGVVLAVLASIVPTAVLGDPAGAQASGRPGFAPIAQIPLPSQNFSGSNTLFVDSAHRRLYLMEKQGDGFELRVFDLDTISSKRFKELAPVRVVSADFPSVKPPKELLSETVSAYDANGERLLWYAGDGFYELRLRDYKRSTGDGVSRWVVSGRPGGGTPVSHPVLNNVLNNASVDQVVSGGLFVQGVEYDPAGKGGTPLLYFVAETLSAEGRGVVVVGAIDASPGTAKLPAEERRLEWAQPLQSCLNLDRANAKLQSLIARSGDWLSVHCSGSEDGSARGVARVKLGADGPDSSTEQFYPGVTGSVVHATADQAANRIYYSTTNSAADARNVLVFDGAVGQGTAGSSSSLGAYVGEVALTQRTFPTRDALDRTTGRWYFQTADALWYQDGRLRRVAQAVRFKTDLEDVGLAQSTNANWHRLFVDPSTATRNARVFVYRQAGETTEKRGVTVNRCPDATKPCFDVYEDTNPQPGEPPPPDERTLNVPEGPGLVGVYSGVTSGYGMKTRLVRGLSSLWPNGIGFVSLEDDRESPPQGVGDYVTDPFFYHGGDCGSRDREITFGRVLQTQLTGGLFDRGSQATALAVDPDVHRPSASDDTRTRDDFQNPDPCVRHFFRTLTKLPATAFQFDPEDCKYADDPDFDPAKHTRCRADLPGDLSPLGRPWPYASTSCSGDENPAAVVGSLQGPGAAQGPLPGSADVACSASADAPVTAATARFKLDPAGSPVLVNDVEVTTKLERVPGGGIVAEATSVVKGISILGVVQIDEMVISATSKAKGYATAEGTTASMAPKREFLGLTVAGRRRCDFCDPQQVVDAINEALGGFGYARAAPPEADFTRGTRFGTLSLAQKDLLLQDADATTNREFGTEWPGLEIVVYRDGAKRGLGRWHIQLGGVFTQAQFGVVSELSPLVLEDLPFELPDLPGLEVEGVGVEAVEPTPPERFLVRIGGEKAQPAAAASPVAEPGILKRIRDGLTRNLGAALLVGALWVLGYGPIHVARRRALLRKVAGT